MKITDYKYRQLRKMVSRAKVRKSVKNLLFCTLNDYKKHASVPTPDVFQQDKQRCLIGAAIHNIGVYNDVVEAGYNWEKIATKEFGVTEDECQKIIDGFDNVAHNNNGDPTTASQYLAQAFGKGNRVA